MRYFIQYHNFEENEGGFPGHGTEPDEKLSEIPHSISSKKKSLLFNSLNDTVFLILGRRFNKNENKKYFLWSKTIINRFNKKLDPEGFYNASGIQDLMCPPPRLNKKQGFPEFFETVQHFRWGLQDITHLEFVNKLKELSEEYKCKNPDQITYKQHIDTFKERCKGYVINNKPKKKKKKKVQLRRARFIEGFRVDF